MTDHQTIDINDIDSSDISKYTENIQNIIDAIGYLSECEETVCVDSFNRFDIFRELSNAYKPLGVYFTYHNKVLALDYLLRALDYCQKAIFESPKFMLTYNNKSNLSKTLTILYNDKHLQ